MKADFPYNYIIKRSSRKTLSIRINPDGTLEVRAPLLMPGCKIERILMSKRGWIDKHMPAEGAPAVAAFTDEELRNLVLLAKNDLPGRAARHAAAMGVSYNKITIRKQHSRWGSCSSKGNISFNALLMLVPEEVRDYVVIHELAHIRQMNHSKDFWNIVSYFDPSFREHRKWLKTEGTKLIERLK